MPRHESVNRLAQLRAEIVIAGGDNRRG